MKKCEEKDGKKHRFPPGKRTCYCGERTVAKPAKTKFGDFPFKGTIKMRELEGRDG